MAVNNDLQRKKNELKTTSAELENSENKFWLAGREALYTVKTRTVVQVDFVLTLREFSANQLEDVLKVFLKVFLEIIHRIDY